ncbi:phosphoglycerate dehydrogenase [Clostridioides mangenotii]|uniref:phosphoglycerate dehydrogenase n=1 Tax=Metaclostridioides mangenotii TaxID=1540 RepID=UPI00214A6272|nr:phosphoglycerate dehydrogenase [Clostridioides mangenotii]MCR1954843.1 phosphoglycerate dehydrogenase [Clostridioides mangenotii]
MKVLFTVKYDEEKINMVKDLGYEVIYKSEKIIENTEEINTADVLVTYDSFSRLDINQMKNLKYIQTTSVGIDQLPKQEIVERQIIVSNNRGGYSIPIGEWIVKSILDIYKNTVSFYKNQKNKVWKPDFTTKEVSGIRVGFLGTGTIAMEAAKRLKAFDVEVWGVNTKGSIREYFDKCFSTSDLDEIFKSCDVVVASMPSTKETIGLVNKDKFELMKEGSVFINIGRGDLINQDDLIDCIGKFRGVALDVFEEEPLSEDNKLWDFDNVIVTPHNSWWSDKNPDRVFDLVYNNLKKFINNDNLKNVVDLKRGY